MLIGIVHHILAYLAAVVALVGIALGIVSQLGEQALWLTPTQWGGIAVVAILFAIYFLVDGAIWAARRGD